MSLEVMSFLFGALLILTAVLGGGFEVRELKVPQVGLAPRGLALVVGLLFVSLGIGIGEPLEPERVDAPRPPPDPAPSGTVVRPDVGPVPTPVAASTVVQSGIPPIPPPQVLSGWLGNGAAATHTMTLEAGVAFTFTGICDEDCSDLDLALLDENFREIDSDFLMDDIPVVAVTPQWTGQFHLRVIMARCTRAPCAYAIEIT
jgi:hypothetical protein